MTQRSEPATTGGASGAGWLSRLARPFVLLVERYYPDPFIFVIVLTLITFAAAWTFTPSTPALLVTAWGDGLASLLAFAAQISLTLITAQAVAQTTPVQKALSVVAGFYKHEWQAYVLIAFLSGLASLVAWSLGLVVGATLAKRVAIDAPARGHRLDYPLLIASAYSGFVVWHMGYSGSAPLFVATPGHALEAMTGVIPVSRTIFSAWNITIAVVALVAISMGCAMMRPSRDAARTLGADVIARLRALEEEPSQKPGQEQTFGERVGRMRIGSLVLALLVAAYLALWFASHGFSLTLDVVNWTFLCAGLALARSPVHYVRLTTDAGQSLGPLLLQYPFYAGIMGLLSGSGLLDVASVWIAQHANATTLPAWAFLSGGVINMFVPSGGGQWAVQGPIFVDAALKLDVDPALIVMSVAYGDQWTNMIQPFWTIPLLAIAGLKVRDVLGYTFITLIVSGIVLVGGLFAAGAILA